MGDSTENTNELDSYGVWIKRPPQDSNEDTIVPEPEAKTDETNLEEDFDMPDFGEIPDTDANPEENEEVDLSEFGDFSSDSNENSEETEEVSLDEFGDFSDSAPSDSNSSGETEVSLDDFIDSSSDAGGTEEVDLDAFLGDSSGDGEVSLDDFLDGDSFTSESAAPKKEDDVSNDEALDINLDFDPPADEIVPTEEIQEETEESEDNEEAFEEEEVIQDEVKEETRPSGDLIPMEEVSLDDFSLDESDAATADAAAAAIASQTNSEEIDLSDFDLDDSDSGPKPVKTQVIDYDLAITDEDEVSSTPAIKEIKTEAKAEEKETDTENTAINNDLLEQIISDLSGLKSEISALKNDLAVLKEKNTFEKEPGFSSPKEISDDVPEITEEEPSGFFGNSDEDETIALSGDELSNIMNSADFTEETVSEIPETNTEAENTIEEPLTEGEINETTAETKEEIIPDEINMDENANSEVITLSEEAPATDETTISDENPVSENDFISEEFPEIEDIPADSFDEDITDDLLSEDATLSNEELDNIAEDASFDESLDISDESNPLEDIPETLPDDIIDEPLLEEEGSVVPVEEESPVIEEEVPVIEEESPVIEENSIIEEEVPVTEEMPEFTDESPIADSEETVTDDFITDFSDDTPFGAIDENEIPLSEENNTDLTMDINEENLEEPVLDESLPEEIDLPKVDDIAIKENEDDIDNIMVESSSSDFMDSVTSDENQAVEEEADETASETPLTEENIEEIADEPVIEDVPELDDEPLDIVFDEPSVDESSDKSENIMDEIMTETPTIDESLTEENVDYLEEDVNSANEIEASDNFQPAEENKGDLPEDIKADVKSVLLYMDQLLENLPEEKIMEFAKSEQFETYKKLFSELGLS